MTTESHVSIGGKPAYVRLSSDGRFFAFAVGALIAIIAATLATMPGWWGR